MENVLVYAALGLAAFTSLVALFFFASRMKLQEQIQGLEDKLTLEQAKRAELMLPRSVSAKKAEPVKPQNENNKHVAELIELRKTAAHFKDEVKQLKAELRATEGQQKELLSRTENETFKLKAENQALIERLRDIETNSADKKRAAALEHELGELRSHLKSAQSELSAATAKLKSERSATEKQKQLMDKLQQQVRELRERLPEEDSPEVAKVDPKMLERWKERALTARQMYQMMRQMRELSDLKLSTYQDAVVDVSRTLLTIKGADSPEIGPKENKADRYLAEAWALIQADTSPNV